MNQDEIQYALAKQIPDMKRGFVIETNYGQMRIEGKAAEMISDLLGQEFEQGTAPASEPIPDLQRLLTFYDAETIPQLIGEMVGHVKQLQEQLRPHLKEPHQINRVREG